MRAKPVPSPADLRTSSNSAAWRPGASQKASLRQVRASHVFHPVFDTLAKLPNQVLVTSGCSWTL